MIRGVVRGVVRGVSKLAAGDDLSDDEEEGLGSEPGLL